MRFYFFLSAILIILHWKIASTSLIYSFHSTPNSRCFVYVHFQSHNAPNLPPLHISETGYEKVLLLLKSLAVLLYHATQRQEKSTEDVAMENKKYPFIQKSSKVRVLCTLHATQLEILHYNSQNDLHQARATTNKYSCLTSMGFSREIDDTRLEIIHPECRYCARSKYANTICLEREK